MINPKWTASSTAYHKRPKEETHAVCYLTECHKTHKRISLTGFAERYRWSRKKARRFLRDAGLEINYPQERTHPKGGYLKLLSEDQLNPKKKDFRIIILGDQ